MKRPKHILLLILAAGTFLRLWNAGAFSFTNDELSALSRLQYGSLGEVIEKGVRPDGHPAGVQVFLYYWIKVFGDGETAVRLPFVAAGALSVLFLFLLARQWFNATAALFCAAALAFLHFPMMYSQLARPYAPGLLFTLVMAWCWTRVVFGRTTPLFPRSGMQRIFLPPLGGNRGGPGGYSLLALSAAACMYTHYFSLFLAAVACVTGLFFIKKSTLKSYAIAWLCAALLFAPHIPITLGALRIGGIGGPGGWLSEPGLDFLQKHLWYTFNESVWVVAAICAVVVFSLKAAIRGGMNRFAVTALAWFLAPMAAGYIYSVTVNPVLQDRVLIFSFPFLLLFVFSAVDDAGRLKKFLLVAFSLICLGSTLIGKSFYRSQEELGSFRQVAASVAAWAERYGGENVTVAVDVIHPYYLQHYIRRSGNTADLKSIHEAGVGEVVKLAAISKTGYFINAWSRGGHVPEVSRIVRTYYPVRLSARYYPNGGAELFAREGTDLTASAFRHHYGFESLHGHWTAREGNITHETYHSGDFSWKMGKEDNYSAAFTVPTAMLGASGDMLHASAWVKPVRTGVVHLAVSFHSGSETKDIRITTFSDYDWSQGGGWLKGYVSLRIPEISGPADSVRIFVWNRSGRIVFVDDVEIEVEKATE